ncbi:MAG: hypothetical protein AAF492_27080, partial [Verrucomicrobiota bacterium]
LLKDAIERFGNTPSGVHGAASNKLSYFCAYFDLGAGIRHTRKEMSWKKSKYRGSAKFSNAFRIRDKRQTEVELKTTV